ncbi:aminomethyl-transferring glycine dehydrogenase subunit GcvPA [Candidatus Venteria ishoeyi]|uniref:Probable glycine dehydrogenase (decarboxylating) subunit 1 n=1 Tax=Candidatus Venteria ishoeyi TaxID=1899563 RepID=A0A1H6FFQ6_9GAMM|nr:aminomethyl-transferring glycine dehydrogenase subunit GcvPA [Candidatus Venteria ishoeyi]SEH08006.1 putative glycine dehydrogenase (decarboxylating) subunit 1 [Candidatus Venteria ishoeyi]
MPYIPHTDADIQTMLETIGVSSIEQLFDEIPAALRCCELETLPESVTEAEVTRLMQSRANQDAGSLCFIGAGAYEHYIPAAIWEITTRGEYYSAYTPYQAEASQGTLQLLYEFQSMMAALTGMDASNASLYDGASGLAEAILMAVRCNRKSKAKQILMPRSVHPNYRKVVETLVKNQGISLREVAFNPDTGKMDLTALTAFADEDIAAVVIPQPNFFGVLEEVDTLTDWAHQHKALAIGLVNPLSLGILEAPGNWGESGADIACGEGQPLGIPLSSGGPYFGFICCKKALVRQMPGRIIGATVDMEGKPGYTLTLQAREQHIRRSKATSNICTNQGLMVTAATIYMAMLGAKGLEQTARTCHHHTRQMLEKFTAIEGIEAVFNSPYFHELVLSFNMPIPQLLRSLAAHNVLGGYDLSQDYPELGNSLLVCATELRTEEDIDRYANLLNRIVAKVGNRNCPIKPKF